MITNRELTAQDWHRLNSHARMALELEVSARGTWIAALRASEVDLLPPLEQPLSPQDLTEAQFVVPRQVHD